jgi:DMSO/TMAO reductase YedYZ molybdopterin-dependent catalytic subunit
MPERKRSDTKYQPETPPSAEDVAPDVIVSPDTRRAQRLPPGQVRTRKWPVLHAGRTLYVDLTQWSLRVDGLVRQPCCWSWEEFNRLPRVKVFADFHCVTRWSRLGNLWEGVATREIAGRVEPLAEARFVLVYAVDGWTTNLPVEYFLAEDSLLAVAHDGEPLSPEHGGPVRLVVPRLYAWKSAKWVTRVEFRGEDEPGFWERLGYHHRGDPWLEERYGV